MRCGEIDLPTTSKDSFYGISCLDSKTLRCEWKPIADILEHTLLVVFSVFPSFRVTVSNLTWKQFERIYLYIINRKFNNAAILLLLLISLARIGNVSSKFIYADNAVVDASRTSIGKNKNNKEKKKTSTALLMNNKRQLTSTLSNNITFKLWNNMIPMRLSRLVERGRRLFVCPLHRCCYWDTWPGEKQWRQREFR
jgi:hypothetical protein